MTQRKFLVLTSPQSFDELDLADLPSGVAGEPITDTFAGDGVTTSFALSETPSGTWLIATINGAVLPPSECAISGAHAVFDTAPDNASEATVTYVTGGLGGGGGVDDTAMHIVGPFTVNYNSANILTTGATLFTPEAGYVIYNLWVEVSVQFAGSGSWYASNMILKTANDELYSDDGLGFPGYFSVDGTSVDTGTDVAKLFIGDMLAFFAVGSPALAAHWFPARFKATTPLLLKMIPYTGGGPGGTMTAGQIKVYAMVGELA